MLCYGYSLYLLRGPSWFPTPLSERCNVETLADEASMRSGVVEKYLTMPRIGRMLGNRAFEMQLEAKALDKAMENRMLARKSHSSESSGSCVGWKGRYSARERTGSSSSNMPSNSMLSEHLVEDEEEELSSLGVGFDGTQFIRVWLLPRARNQNRLW